MPMHFSISLQNIFHSNQHAHNYLNECNSKEVLRTCTTCEVFNIAEKYKPQLQCNTSDMYTDIKWDSRQVIQEGYKTMCWWLTHTAKEPVHRHYDPAVLTHQNHHYVSTVHDIASDTAHSNPENSSPVFLRGNTLISIQLKLTKSFIKHFK